ncbi:nitrilase-related carbon-nitrogen hydrolase [Chelatococcus asaccharovorans]|uniref:nitrilase-related carbon-nitrogen hydrolase n=1 Tax=Chelatococcus asaccharovorans TaxID=28210 RepID=UPI00224C717F|nr:nitrilase-related carbon-nitrogen hydrolase [Chelatococcus asaccharovorans]CAH1652295.1 putative amidohydrolase [Chelatococcus asaccharovorans]CAH1693448.1 putative amidohydrolase [Chelatococcus asaccharovorans]
MTWRVAAIQFTAMPGRALENRARSLQLIENAAADGARVIVLPELAVSGYTLNGHELSAAAEPLDGPTLSAWTDVAKRLGVVIAGGFCESDGDRLYNSALLVGPDGLLLHYRKLHLFDGEKLIFTPGDRGLTVATTPFGRIGLCVCYDLRFVEVMRALALQGAELIAVPTAWVRGFDKVDRDGDGLIGQARGAIVQANLNQVYIACASQGGEAGDIAFLGSSLVADPYGRILAGPLAQDTEAAAIAPMDPAIAQAALVRSERVKPREDRRTDVYGVTLGGRML